MPSVLSKSQKRALFKIAVDLVKVDNQIHGNEVVALEQLQQQCQIEQEEIDMAHYITLAQAVACLKLLDKSQQKEILDILSRIIGADNDIDHRENLLLSAIQMATDGEHYACIVSALDAHADMVNDQLIYLESQHSAAARQILDSQYEYVLLSNILQDTGINLFYIPAVLNQLGVNQDNNTSQLGILRKSLEFVVPAGAAVDMDRIKYAIDHLDTITFSQFVCTRYHVQMPYKACLMIAVQDGCVLDDDAQTHRCTDYLCLDVTQDLKQRLMTFVQILNHQQFALSYKGYYKTLFEYLSAERKINSAILITSAGELTWMDLDNKPIRFNSSPQSNSLYLLLIRYGGLGISHTLWEAATGVLTQMEQQSWQDVSDICGWLLARHDDGSILVYNLMILYRYFSLRDMEGHRIIEYLRSIITHKSSLKNYINAAISEVGELANKEQYMVNYSADNRAYYMQLNVRSFFVQTANGCQPLTDSDLWKQLQ